MYKEAVSVFLLMFLLSGCHHAHRHHVVKTVKPAKVVTVLDAEHGDSQIVVVKKSKPRKKCWRHGMHWHCRK